MPTANPAAFARPKDKDSDGRKIGKVGVKVGVAAMALATALSIGLGSVEAPVAAAKAGPSCSRHSSLTRPPSAIRVLIVHSGRIQRVPFQKYVVTVMGKEWPSYLPQQVIEAGAVAVKQYAWYHAVYSSRSSRGRCYDVKDSTSDQLYKPHKSRVRADHYNALGKTWNVTLRKDGRFFMTGYRRGDKVRCGRDRTGYKLYARSAIQCARSGYGWQQILRTYYGPRLDLVGAGGGSSARSSDVFAADSARATNSQRAADSRRAADSARATRSTRRTPSTAQDAQAQVTASGVSAGGLAGGIGAALTSGELLVQ